MADLSLQDLKPEGNDDGHRVDPPLAAVLHTHVVLDVELLGREGGVQRDLVPGLGQDLRSQPEQAHARSTESEHVPPRRMLPEYRVQFIGPASRRHPSGGLIIINRRIGREYQEFLHALIIAGASASRPRTKNEKERNENYKRVFHGFISSKYLSIARRICSETVRPCFFEIALSFLICNSVMVMSIRFISIVYT